MKNNYVLLLVSTLVLSGCTPALPEQERPMHWGQELHEEHNFYQISNELYRSEQPSDELTPLLKQYAINVVINLRSRDKDTDILSNEDLKLKHVPIHTWAMNREDLLNVMQLIQQARQNNEKYFYTVITVQTVPVPVWPCTGLFFRTGALKMQYRK